MSDDHAPGEQRHRGRVVVLVDNGVIGDSRVQKTAQSGRELRDCAKPPAVPESSSVMVTA